MGQGLLPAKYPWSRALKSTWEFGLRLAHDACVKRRKAPLLTRSSFMQGAPLGRPSASYIQSLLTLLAGCPCDISNRPALHETLETTHVYHFSGASGTNHLMLGHLKQ